MELNEREKNIVNLINQLSDVASDEKSTQEVIDGLLAKIRLSTKENICAEMEEAKKNVENRTETKIPQRNLPDGIRPALPPKAYGGPTNFQNMVQTGRLGRLLFTRMREVKVPCKAHPTDAGIDFFVPEAKSWDVDFRNKVMEYSRNPVNTDIYGVSFEGDVLKVQPNAHVAIPSGIKTIIPTGLAMMMVNKSGVATKLKLDHSACLIDSEYRDELIFCFFNHNTEVVEIKPGMKLTQGLLVPVINLELNEVLNCVYEDVGKSTDRGGGFGSSDGK